MPTQPQSSIAFDIRAKLVAGLLVIISIVSSAPPSLSEFVVTFALLSAVGVIFETNFSRAFKAALLVIPFAGFIAACAPLAYADSLTIAHAYRAHWPLITALLSKAFLSAYIVSIVVNSVDIPHLIAGLHGLKMPTIFITLFTFLYRFGALFREQIAQMQRALKSRAPHLKGARLLVTYGKLGGNTFVRAYERGEQIYNAMVSRGYDGALATSSLTSWSVADTLLIIGALISAFAIVLY